MLNPTSNSHRKRAVSALRPMKLALFLGGLWGCSMLEDGMEVPQHLVVPEIVYQPGELQGTASTNITDLWVYSSTDVVGVFPLPAVVPLIEEDLQGGAITLLAGIRENGLSDRRAPYPFYTTVEAVPNGTEGSRDTLIPQIQWVENVRHIPIEDFETSNVFGSMIGGAGLNRTNEENEVFEGDESGRLTVNSGSPVVRVRTVEQEYSLTAGVPAFLEMDYRCDQSFAIGLFGFRDGLEFQHPAMVLTATDDGAMPTWNKIYVDLAPLVTAQGPADHFEVYIECILEANRVSGSVGLDNLRILSY